MRRLVLATVLIVAAMLLAASPATSSHGGDGGETGKARGHGTSAEGFGEFSFNATRYASGHFHGKMTLKPVGGLFAGETVHAEVFCVGIIGNAARLLGRIANDPTGRGLLFDVVDGFNAAGDIDTFRGFVTPGPVTSFPCGVPDTPFQAIVDGNIVVDDEFSDFEF